MTYANISDLLFITLFLPTFQMLKILWLFSWCFFISNRWIPFYKNLLLVSGGFFVWHINCLSATYEGFPYYIQVNVIHANFILRVTILLLDFSLYFSLRFFLCKNRKIFCSQTGHVPFWSKYYFKMGFLGGSVVRNPPANAGDGLSLGQEDPLEEEMTTYSSILAREIPWTEEPDGLWSTGSQKSWI